MMKKNYKIKILSAVPREYEYQIKNGSLSSVSRTPHCEEIFVEAEGGTGCRETLVKAVWKEGGFTFCLTQVREECPIFSSRLQIAVVPASDRRNYFEIAEQIKRNKKPTDRERTEAETPFTYARAKKLEWHRCPTSPPSARSDSQNWKRDWRMCSEDPYLFFLLVFRCRARKKRPLPQHSVCDKSLKPTHDIGHFCRDDAAMQHPAGPAECPLLPFIDSN